MSWDGIKITLRQRLGIILLPLGFLFFGIFFSLKLYHSRQGNILSFSQPPPLMTTPEENPLKLPLRIIIPSRKIDLPIEEGEILNGEWQLSASAVSHLKQSGLPGEPGKMIIYGHNLHRLLGPIRWIEKGAEILIENKKEEIYIYEVIETKIVSSDQIEVLFPTEEPTLTLYTCFGFLDRQRFVVIGKLKANG